MVNGKHTLLEISSFPDCLLIEIIARLPNTKQAIQTGTLSKRWQHLWREVTNVIIKPEFRHDSPQFYSSVERITSQRSRLNLNKFHLHASYTKRTESQLNNCICNAINRNVQEVDLDLSFSPFLSIDKGFLLPECLLINSSIMHLTLSRCTFELPYIISWKNLKSLSITYGYLDEDLIASILSGSPLLETFALTCCYGFQRMDITNTSVKNLALFESSDPYSTDMVKINAPYIKSLAFKGYSLWHELVLLNVCSLIKARLDYSINLGEKHKKMHEEMLERLILSLGHVKELELIAGKSCLAALAGLQAKGFIFPSNLKVLQKIDSDFDSD